MWTLKGFSANHAITLFSSTTNSAPLYFSAPRCCLFPKRLKCLIENTTATPGGRGGEGGLRPDVQPLTSFIYHFSRKRYPFRIRSVEKWHPFHIPCLVPCRAKLPHIGHYGENPPPPGLRLLERSRSIAQWTMGTFSLSQSMLERVIIVPAIYC